MIDDVGNESYATALAAIYDPQEHMLTFASAGHCGPVIRRANGIPKEYQAQGCMLGIQIAEPREQVSVDAPSGTILCFFTDGLTEATRDVLEGYQRICNALANLHFTASDNPAKLLVDIVLREEKARDDVAVLLAMTH